ncbi:MAG TPA: hypothetical protein VFP17_11115, partial [Solirubrobacterales bacterium]|nr:hypothetical protein [Solirubrobacterales bacterium]
PSMTAEGADMQTATLLQAADRLRVAAAAVVIAAEKSDSGQLRDEELEAAARRVGQAASRLLST